MMFGFQHSGMARKMFKEEIFPVSPRLERTLYIFSSAFVIHMITIFWMPIDLVVYYEFDDTEIFTFFHLFGYALLNASGFMLSISNLMGYQ